MKNILKILRAKHNLTQEQLALNIGISRPALSDIETGKVIPNGRTMIKLANYFEIPAEQIFFENIVIHEEQRRSKNSLCSF
ncbi:transcriptional regulator [Clostridiaceae bacterium 14S0207]|nr:transcriptional regulator [Clostridiaceae bacterium 14S0207]